MSRSHLWLPVSILAFRLVRTKFSSFYDRGFRLRNSHIYISLSSNSVHDENLHTNQQIWGTARPTTAGISSHINKAWPTGHGVFQKQRSYIRAAGILSDVEWMHSRRSCSLPSRVSLSCYLAARNSTIATAKSTPLSIVGVVRSSCFKRIWASIPFDIRHVRALSKAITLLDLEFQGAIWQRIANAACLRTGYPFIPIAHVRIE